MKNSLRTQTIQQRVIQGAMVGSGWGALFGAGQGIGGLVGFQPRLFRADFHWALEIAICVFAGIGIGGVIFAIGKGIAGKWAGAAIGAIVCLFIALLSGSAVSRLYWWHPVEKHPFAVLLAVSVGVSSGAVIGALVHRRFLRLDEETDEPD